MTYALDFSLLPDLNTGSIRTALSDDTERQLSIFPQTFDRAQSAMYFAYMVDNVEAFFPETSSTKRRESLLRASLAEFVSMEETLERDLSGLGINVAAIKITDTSDPLLHLIRELRNLEIHLYSSKIAFSEGKFYLPNKVNPEKSIEIELKIWCIGDIQARDFSRLRNSKRYSDGDIKHMLDWFNASQKIYGIHELLRIAIQRYSDAILEVYRL